MISNSQSQVAYTVNLLLIKDCVRLMLTVLGFAKTDSLLIHRYTESISDSNIFVVLKCCIVNFYQALHR